MNAEIAEYLDKWYVGDEAVNHWIHESGLSIRATHPEMQKAGKGLHIASSDGWVVEVYPVGDWPFLPSKNISDIRRWHPNTAHGVRRLVAGLMLSVAEVEAAEANN